MQVSIAEKRNCLACGEELRGRVDKKFCNDYCRNNYNNGLKSKHNQDALVRSVNAVLLKNRKILAGLLPDEEETAKANKEKLSNLGFQFRYHTHVYTTRTGKTYHYCYDYGYLPLDNDWFLVVRKREDPVTHSPA